MLPAALTPKSLLKRKLKAYEQLETSSHWPSGGQGGQRQVPPAVEGASWRFGLSGTTEDWTQRTELTKPRAKWAKQGCLTCRCSFADLSQVRVVLSAVLSVNLRTPDCHGVRKRE